MPPLRDIERGLDGDALKALEEAGHGQRIAVVDPSYPIPEGARVIKYQGESSASALHGILKLVPVDKPANGTFEVTYMEPDSDDPNPNKHSAEEDLGMATAINAGVPLPLPRFDTEEGLGFYSVVNDAEAKTLFFRTRDTKAYACATFIVGHSQE